MPDRVVTFISPLAPVPTIAVIFVSLTKAKEEAATPPKETAVTPVNFVPLIVISVPVVPDLGEKEAMVGFIIGVGGDGVASVLLHLIVKKGKTIAINKNMIFFTEFEMYNFSMVYSLYDDTLNELLLTFSQLVYYNFNCFHSVVNFTSQNVNST